MNFKTVYKQGQLGMNKGLDTGLRGLNAMTNGVHKRAIYTVASAPKVGKSTFTDFVFILSPYLEWLKNEKAYPIEWVYFSFEMDRIQKEFKFACFFFYHDYGIRFFNLPDGSVLEMSSEYLLGRERTPNGDVVLVLPEHEEILKKIYENRIIPLFGEYDENGVQIKQGVITFIEEKTNPTGIRNYLIALAQRNGKLNKAPYTTIIEGKTVQKEKIVSYTPNDPNKYTIVILDTIRKPSRERGYTMKENIDKMAEYFVDIRNLYGFTIIPIIHMNRSVVDPARLKMFGEFLHATSDDIKDSGNLSEESDFVITLFDPNDDKYNLKRHFGVDLQDNKGTLLHPEYRSIHLVESRHTKAPALTQVDMYGGVNFFTSEAYKIK